MKNIVKGPSLNDFLMLVKARGQDYGQGYIKLL
jgi:hypothetical protein